MRKTAKSVSWISILLSWFKCAGLVIEAPEYTNHIFYEYPFGRDFHPGGCFIEILFDSSVTSQVPQLTWKSTRSRGWGTWLVCHPSDGEPLIRFFSGKLCRGQSSQCFQSKLLCSQTPWEPKSNFWMLSSKLSRLTLWRLEVWKSRASNWNFWKTEVFLICFFFLGHSTRIS